MTKVRAVLKAKEIIDNLEGRKGFEFGDIDEEILDEIIEDIAEIIEDD
jgi:hypothetical protein